MCKGADKIATGQKEVLSRFFSFFSAVWYIGVITANIFFCTMKKEGYLKKCDNNNNNNNINNNNNNNNNNSNNNNNNNNNLLPH
jgi:hypothetical protein